MGFFSAIKKFFEAEPEKPKQEDNLQEEQLSEQESQPVAEARIAEDVGQPDAEDVAIEIEEIIPDGETFSEEEPQEQKEEVIVEEVLEPDGETIIEEIQLQTQEPEIDKNLLEHEEEAHFEVIKEPETSEESEEIEEVTSEESKEPEEVTQAEPEQKITGSIEEEAQPEDVTLIETEPAASDENALLLTRLRQSDAKLSSWLNIVLEGVDEANDLFWQRLQFLLKSLQAPQEEIDAFLADFKKWLERMEYNYVDEFRSELQYRLALALDLEDEEDERNRLLLKLNAGLAKTREQLGRGLNRLFSGSGELNQQFWEELEELFIMSDMGYDAAIKMTGRLKERAAKENITKASDARRLLMTELEDIFKQPKSIKAVNKPEVILMIGVNGVGKTTTIAKLAHRRRMQGEKVLIAAADTFRAAAIEQLQVWAERVGADFYAKAPGSDPASVAWEAVDYAQKNDIDVLYIDTAGRLQTKVNLMEELGKIRQVTAKKHLCAPHRSILVLDATTGQNALSQAKLFKEAAGVDEIILTKLDGTAKGGVAIAVAMQENLPITYIGLGEKLEDLRPFNGRDFAAAILGETQEN